MFHAKLKKVKKILSQWSKEAFGNIFQKVANLKETVWIKEIQFEITPSQENREELSKANAELKKYWSLEEDSGSKKLG